VGTRMGISSCQMEAWASPVRVTDEENTGWTLLGGADPLQSLEQSQRPYCIDDRLPRIWCALASQIGRFLREAA